jgi:hypothetical protein
VEAPDYVEAIVGWRLWRITRRRRQIRLSSLFLDDVWPWLEPLEARCAVPGIGWRRSQRRHTAPHADCDCGIHATLWSRVAPEVSRHGRLRSVGFVVGEVALWGSVVECQFGWRSSFAYPQRMFALIPSRAHELELARVVSALESYGVPVEPVELSGAAAAIEGRAARDGGGYRQGF